VVYSAKEREYQLVANSTVPCFLNSCYCHTHNVDFFTVICPRAVPAELGALRLFFLGGGGTLKKFPVCAPQLQNRVGAYDSGICLSPTPWDQRPHGLDIQHTSPSVSHNSELHVNSSIGLHHVGKAEF